MIEFSDKFLSDLKKLIKKYRKIEDDINHFIKNIDNEISPQNSIGNGLYKIRVANTSIPTGKSGGFRIIVFVKIKNEKIILLTIYSKNDIENISESEIVEILKQFQEKSQKTKA